MSESRANAKLDVLLVGRKLPDNENLGLGYLLAALRAAGLAAEMQPLNSWLDMEPICEHVLLSRAKVVGLAMPNSNSAILPIGLGELLRARGYSGHITAGGGYATLARHWLLERYDWLDSVIRFAGEVPLTQLATHLHVGTDLSSIPGLTTRLGDGPAAPVLDSTPMQLVPERGSLPAILGHRVAHINATRGCPGRCDYCGPAALQRLEVAEGLRGSGRRELRERGVGGVRRRSLASICNEMAHLYRERDVRYFYFVDEHMLPRESQRAHAFLDQWRRELGRRRVGPFGIGTMLRADALDELMVEKLREIGLVRAFLGIELASQQELAIFGRGGSLNRALHIMQHCEQIGVATVCNVMLLHPYSTIESLEKGIEFLGGIDRGTFEVTQMMVYHGTRLYERLRTEGRLLGNPLHYDYGFCDPRVHCFAQLFHLLRHEAFGNYSVAFKSHDVWLTLSLASRLNPKLGLSDLRARLEDRSRELRSLRTDTLRWALALAAQPTDVVANVRGETADSRGVAPDPARISGFDAIRAELNEIRRAVLAIEADLDEIARAVVTATQRPSRLFCPTRSAAVAVLNFCLMGASVTGCQQAPDRVMHHAARTEQPVEQVGISTVAPESHVPDLQQTPDEEGHHVTRTERSTDELENPLVGGEGRVERGHTITVVAQYGGDQCDTAVVEAEKQAVRKILSKVGTCQTAEARNSQHHVRLELHTDVSFSYGCQIESCDKQRLDSLETQLKQEIEQLDLKCSLLVKVKGQDEEELERVMDAVKACDKFADDYYEDGTSFTVHIDDNGLVADVTWGDPERSRLPLQCLKKALGGLVFPCHIGRDICFNKHAVIIE